MMKSIRLLCVWAVTIIASVLSISAADFEVDGICYNVISDNEVEVTSSDSVKYTGEVFIPSTVINEGTTYQVTRIGKNAFAYCSDLTLIGIPEGVTEIAQNGFTGCSKLENIDLPNSLVKIGNFAFYGCLTFNTFHFPRNLAEIGYDTFQNCRNIQYFTCSSLNQHFKVVGGVLFTKDMTQLVWYPAGASATSYDIPNSVTSLHDYCFSFSNSLVNVTIPESVTWMGMNIFRGCKNIAEVDVPDGVTHMGVTVFGDCINLTRVHLPAGLDSLMNCTFMGCNNLTEVTVPRNVSYIDEQAFLMCKVKSIIFEEGSRLKTIGKRAFYECTQLQSINIPNTITSIGSSSFTKCKSLKSVYLGDNLTDVGQSVFWECDSLVEAVVLGTFPTVKNLCVSCPALKRVKIGSKDGTPGVTILENCALANCEQIEYVELGASIDSLAHLALDDLKNLKVLICWAAVPPRCHDYWHCFDPYPQEMTAAVYVPKASLEAYRTANEWKLFNTIVAIEDVGDINGNGMIDIADVTDLIDQLLTGEYENAPIADVNFDGTIGIADVTALIDILLNGN